VKNLWREIVSKYTRRRRQWSFANLPAAPKTTINFDFNSIWIRGNDIANSKNIRTHDDICTSLLTVGRNNRTHFR